jgi:hypothetical protein
LGWLFYLVLTAAVSSAQTPATSSQRTFTGRPNRRGKEKDAAMSFVSAALQLSDAVTARHIVDEDKFKLGLSNVIDGVVLCTPCFDVFEASAA